MMMLSLPLRSNSWLSASTIKRAVSAGAAVAAGAAGAAAGAALKSGAGAGAAATGAAAEAGAALPSGLPQLEQNSSPAGLVAPQLEQT